MCVKSQIFANIWLIRMLVPCVKTYDVDKHVAYKQM